MATRQKLEQFIKSHVLLILIILTITNGLVFIFLVPPWMHYDEPGHFEYAWLAANLDHWPKGGEYDQSMRREVGASMLEHDFIDYSIYHLLKIDEPISIIIPQTGDIPLYYFIVSLPLRLIKYSDITLQLYIARFVSLGLLVVTILICYKTCSLIFGKSHALTWMIPLFIIFLPSFIDIMTAVNNDVAAIFAFTLFIYSSTKIIIKGFSLRNIIYLILSVILCVFSKSSAWLAVPLSVIVAMLAIIKKFDIKTALIIFFLLLAIGLPLFFSWHESSPANFYASNMDFLPKTKSTDSAPLGSRIIMQESQSGEWKGFYQTINPEILKGLKGKTLTFGTWIWADSPTTIKFPRIYCTGSSQPIIFQSAMIDLTENPTFFSDDLILPETISNVCWIRFYPTTDAKNNVYYDGIVLTQNTFTDGTPPVFSDKNAKSGTWQNQTFVNYFRNGSGEKTWPTVSPLTQKLLPDQFNDYIFRIFTVLDFKAHSWYFKTTAAHLFRSFWAVFGWGNTFLLGGKPYRIFLPISIFYLLGVIITFIKKSQTSLSIKLSLFYYFTIAAQVFIVIYRGVGSWYGNTFIPRSRYLFPVLLPIAIIMVQGLDNLFCLSKNKTKIKYSLLKFLYVCGLICIFLWSVISLIYNMD